MRLTTQLMAVGLALIDQTSGQNLTIAELANLEHYWSYGRSAPVYPTPQTSGRGEWATAYGKAKNLVAQMTDFEKNNITYGQTATTGCSGVSGSVPRLAFPGLCLSDAGNGLRATDGVNGYPSGIHAGASWNQDLVYQRAFYMGEEFKNKGVSVALGPVAGPLGKLAKGGRNWEGFSNDPYLSGKLVYETIVGLEKNVMSCVKHYIANEQETNRIPPVFIPGAQNQSLSSNVDPKTEHELYVWPFQDAVRAGAASVMCSYNKINNSYGCQDSHNLNGVLKGELGFQGFVVSDWTAQKSGVASADAGLDMAMPDSVYWENGNLSQAVSNGSLAQSRLDDMATRIVAAWYRLEEVNSPAFENPGFGMPLSLLAPHTLVDGRNPESADTIFQSAVEGHVLVKNVNNTLPLSKPKLLSLFGYDGTIAARNTPSTGTKWSLGLEGTQVFPDGMVFNDTYLLENFLSSAPPAGGPGVALNGTLISGGGSGSTTPAYIDAPYDAFARQAYQDRTILLWNFADFNVTVDQASDHCIVFINSLASEGWDRPDLADADSDQLVEIVASQCSSTIVVLHNAGIRLVDEWINNPNITAVIYGHLPGQDSGRALIELMYGNQSPSGRMPYTVAKQDSDYGSLLNPVVPAGIDYYTQDNYTEGVYIDYKHFIAQNITPRYEFGFGLTYTTFEYSDISVSLNDSANTQYLAPNTTFAEGGLTSLWDTVATVSFSITNSGSVKAAEVPQLYVGIPGGPEKVLRGFSKELLEPGQSCSVSLALNRRDLSTWTAEGWALQGGSYPLYVGKSVLDIHLTSSLTIA